MAGLCLVAALGVGGAVATAASARPVWRTCVKSVKLDGHGTGFFTNSTCSEVSEAHEGGYEEAVWQSGEKATLKGKGGKSVFYVYNDAGIAWKVECARDTSIAEITGAVEGTIDFSFKKCTATPEPGGTPVRCSSAAGKGDIDTGNVAIELGTLLSDYPGYIALRIGTYPPAAITSFECGSAKFELQGGLDAPEIAEPVLNVSCSKILSLSFTVNSEGVGYPYAGGEGPPGPGVPGMVIGGTSYGAGLETTQTLKGKQTLCVDNREPNT